MRAFWASLALLAALGVWFALREPSAPSVEPMRADGPSTSEKPAPDGSAALAADASARTPPDQAPRVRTEQPGTTDTPLPAPTTPPPTASQRPAPDLDLLGEDGARIAPADALAPAPVAAPIAAPDSRRPEDTVRRIDARTLELDGRFRITGNGSADDPYRISWELLTSASATVDPARGLLEAPPWVRLLDGTYIEISAYYSTPVRVRRASSVLLTLNRWDGCCIGLPPTPFDAIDASLREPIDMNALHLISFGTFRGRLVVEPLVAAQYLLGLYRIEDATFEKK